jgi:hypothetical protein
LRAGHSSPFLVTPGGARGVAFDVGIDVVVVVNFDGDGDVNEDDRP